MPRRLDEPEDNDWTSNIPDYEPAPEPKVALSATSFVWRPEAQIPPRRWLYGRHLLRRFLSVDVAAGGVGKSSVKIVEAVAMASGRNLLGKEVQEGPLRVWLYNLEDPLEEIERRIHATCKQFQIDPADLGDRLYVDSGRDQSMIIAEETVYGARIMRPVSDALKAEIIFRQIDVLSIDPFVSAHTVNENDNGAIDMVSKEYASIADVCNCSINLVHHVRKQNGSEATADSARGASALIGAARSVIVYNRMTEDEAAMASVPSNQRSFYFRTSNDKANLSPPEAADWHRMNNVELDNGDSVGVACPWQWPDVFDGLSKENTRSVQRAVDIGSFRKDPRSSRWVGNIIATVIGMDPDKDKAKIKGIIKQWISTDVLREVEGVDEDSKKRLFVEVGTWIVD